MNNKFNDLFIFDLANNHQGDIRHAKTIVKETSEAVKKYNIKAAIKFQFRDLDTFVHKEKKTPGRNKMVDRFLTTRLNDNEFLELKKYAESLGFLTACTPFDESSVKKVVKMGFNYIKIASCSARDWPLIQKISKTGIPLIASTGGLSLDQIDELVFFIHAHSRRHKSFALMHCVSIYPTPDDMLNLKRIDLLRQRYPDLTIGWSTHEDPADFETIKLAYSLGARVFEKHIGKATEKYKLNRYSASRENIDKWLKSFVHMKKKMVSNEVAFLKSQRKAIKELTRGVFAKKDIRKEEKIKKEDIYFAFPAEGNTMDHLKNGGSIRARQNIDKDMPITSENIVHETRYQDRIEGWLLKLRTFLQKNNFTVKHYNHIDISCHRGLKEFNSIGSYFIDCSRYPYIKKICVMLPGQFHPSHKHTDRSELFYVMSGALKVKSEKKIFDLKEGEKFLIDKNKYHEFSTVKGVIFEEISYTENYAESIYKDDKINNTDRSRRVIRVENKVI